MATKYVPGKKEESPLFEKLGLPFGYISIQVGGEDASPLIATEQSGHNIVDKLLQSKVISAEEAQTLNEEIGQQGLAADVKAVVERARAVSIPADHAQKALLEFCYETECMFKKIEMPHAHIIYDDDQHAQDVFSVEATVSRLFWLNNHGNIDPDDAIRMIVEAADQGLFLEITNVWQRLQEIKEKDFLEFLMLQTKMLKLEQGF